MSGTTEATRLILFEVAGAVYAFPIADVIEVLDYSAPVGIPTLSPSVGGVVNHHGETLPVLESRALFGGHAAKHAGAEHLLVLAGVGSEAGQLGVPVERVLGLAEATLALAPGGLADDWIRERVSVDGRVVAVLDAERCLARAEACFSESVAPSRGALAMTTGPDTTVEEFSTGEGSQ